MSIHILGKAAKPGNYLHSLGTISQAMLFALPQPEAWNDEDCHRVLVSLRIPHAAYKILERLYDLNTERDPEFKKRFPNAADFESDILSRILQFGLLTCGEWVTDSPPAE